MNVGFVFTNDDLNEIRDLLLTNKVKAPARAGAIAPLDVKVPAQNTGLGPEKTSFFQALQIPTKITKGTIEIIQEVYDAGSIFDPEILDITDEDIKQKFMAGVVNVAAVCLTINYPTIASVPHSIVNGMKNLLAVAAVTEISFKEAETLKEFLADPSKFAAAAPAAAAEAVPAAAAAKEPEPESEEDDDMGFGLFD